MTGILPINKPQNMTSHTAAAAIKRLTGEKTGHTGTLDPMATGVLPVLVGKATRLAEFLSGDKIYKTVIRLGIETDTGDITGKIINESTVKTVNKKEFNKVLVNFKGGIMQIPPMYSAISIGGVRLYKLARNGVEVERKPRKITIYSLELLSADIEKGEYELLVNCSKGTYIRSLACDIGRALNTYAAMIKLERTMSGNIFIEDCFNIEDMIKKEKEEIEKLLLKPEKLFELLPKAVLPNEAIKFYKNGGAVAKRRFIEIEDSEKYRVYSSDGDFLGLAGSSIYEDEEALKAVWFNEV